MASDYSYTFFRVSQTNQVKTSAVQYRNLRLNALKTSPDSFSSTYDIESAFGDEVWEQRLCEKGKQTFICAASHVTSGDTEWVGQVTLRGPLNRSDYDLPRESGQPPADQDVHTELWQMLSLFNLPEHRGRGLGKRLCQEALLYLEKERPASSVLVRLMVKPQNTATVRLYQSLGFEDVGRCTLAEALVANGDVKLLPDDYSTRNEYTTRVGLIMTRRISCRVGQAEDEK
jgi:ribosomal protein S18 acetylase RimI-like enzyme